MLQQDTQIWPFFPIIWPLWIFLLKVTIIVCLSCIEQSLLGTTVKKYSSILIIIKKDMAA